MKEIVLESGEGEPLNFDLAHLAAFIQSERNWQALVATLDRPARSVPEVAKLFSRPRPE